MNPASESFEQQLRRILVRYAAQNGMAALSAGEIASFTANLRQLVGDRGLPRPLRVDEMGQPGEMSAEEVEPLVAFVLRGSTRAPEFGTVARQLVKACFHPEFKKCRESYHEVAADGSCRRQELTRVRLRVSGSHCVDCPYWISLNPQQHAACLAADWVGDTEEFAANRDVFLPEDFRALRLIVRGWAATASSND
ncbi:MAG: hypothetical protein ABIZ04_15090 [Opitutus sp.]